MRVPFRSLLRPPTPAMVRPVLGDPVRRIGARVFDFSRQVAVMGIVNRTPDSFYDRGATFALDEAVEAVPRGGAPGGGGRRRGRGGGPRGKAPPRGGARRKKNPPPLPRAHPPPRRAGRPRLPAA